MANYKPLTDVKVDESGTYYIGEDNQGNWFRVPADNKGGSVRLMKRNIPSTETGPIGESPVYSAPERPLTHPISDINIGEVSKTLAEQSGIMQGAIESISEDTTMTNETMNSFNSLKDRIIGTREDRMDKYRRHGKSMGFSDTPIPPEKSLSDFLEEAVGTIGELKRVVDENMTVVGNHMNNLAHDFFGGDSTLSPTGKKIAQGTESTVKKILNTPEGEGMIPDKYPVIGSWEKLLNIMGPGPKVPR